VQYQPRTLLIDVKRGVAITKSISTGWNWQKSVLPPVARRRIRGNEAVDSRTLEFIDGRRCLRMVADFVVSVPTIKAIVK
jgi:hypothetical protein